MEQINPENQGGLEGRFNKAGTLLLALVGTSAVCLTIVVHWRTYDWINKLLAVGLLLNLARFPLTVSIKGRKEITTRRETWVQNRLHLDNTGHHSVQPAGLSKI